MKVIYLIKIRDIQKAMEQLSLFDQMNIDDKDTGPHTTHRKQHVRTTKSGKAVQVRRSKDYQTKGQQKTPEAIKYLAKKMNFGNTKGFTGPNGNMVAGYQWKSKLGEKWSDYEGGLVSARVSDWDSAEKCDHCGRKIVKCYYAYDPKTDKFSCYGGDHLHLALGFDKPFTKKKLSRIEAETQQQVSDHKADIDGKMHSINLWSSAIDGPDAKKIVEVKTKYQKNSSVVPQIIKNKEGVYSAIPRYTALHTPEYEKINEKWDEAIKRAGFERIPNKEANMIVNNYFNGPANLPLTEAKEEGVLFKTGLPVKFTFIHNAESSKNFGSRFQQDIEPTGFYMTHSENATVTPGWIQGRMEFKNPLVIKENTTEGNTYDENSWKSILSKRFSAKGKALTKKLLSNGYDGIVTVNKYGTSEIIQLKH